MPELPAVAPGEVIDSTTFGNPVVERVVSRYADDTARDAASPTPENGEVCFVESTGQFQIFNAGVWGNAVVLHANGSEAAPSVAFASDPDTGMYRLGANEGVLAAGGVSGLSFNETRVRPEAGATGSWLMPYAAGTLAAPAYAFRGDSDTGMYRVSANSVALAAGAVEVFRGNGTSVFLAPVYADTNGSAANVFVGTDGRLYRSTSARKYKTNIEPAPQLADLVLNPVTFHHDGDDQDYIGFIADEIAEQDGRAGVFDGDDIEDYDLRAVVAVLAAKVNRLETELAATIRAES